MMMVEEVLYIFVWLAERGDPYGVRHLHICIGYPGGHIIDDGVNQGHSHDPKGGPAWRRCASRYIQA